MTEGVVFGATLPPWLLYPATLLIVLSLALRLWRVPSAIAAFTCFALAFRYLAAAHHTFTYSPSPIGLSWNALGSSAVFLLGLLLIRSRHLLLKQLIPCYFLIAIVILSGLANHTIPKIIDVGVKFGYLVIMTIGVYEGLLALGEKRMTNLLLWAFAAPIGFQALSIAFHVVKASEGDGSVSYIGGYNHEAAFSIILATGLLIACFATGIALWRRSLLLFVFMAAIVLANYRTAILAFAPLIVTQFNLDIVSRFSPRQRSIIAVALLGLSVLGVLSAAWMFRERFQDIVTTFESIDKLIKPQSEYTMAEKQLLSARPFIWSAYIEAYIDGSLRNHLLGYGPDSWIGVMTVYAHNTLISALYEYGLLGVTAFVVLWATMLYASLWAPAGVRGKLIAGHLSFLLLNMATMPHWMLEGDILYGVLCGYTIYMLRRTADERKPMKMPTGAVNAPFAGGLVTEVAPKPRPNMLKP
ncbi:O-antigen ligase family protein [Dongia sp.]|uniref:O-antigen ligase family protein n=1 Tax=Dongia sp. TaxID=1977262 RepID=UPI0035B1A3CC